MASSSGPRSYADALGEVTKAKIAANRARLKDPGEHFPYKADAARQALETPPDPDTSNHPEHWYISTAIIDASAVYVEAQAAWLKAGSSSDRDDDTRRAYDDAAARLVEARRVHRRGRPVAPVVVAGHPEAIEQKRSAMRVLGRSGFSAEQIAVQFNAPVHEVQGALSGLED